MEVRNHELTLAGTSISRVLEKNHLLKPYKLYQAKRDWKKIAGAQIARYSYVLKFEDTTAVIAVLSPVYMNYLFMYKKRLVGAFNDYFGGKVLTDIRFVKRGRKPIKTIYENQAGVQESAFSALSVTNIRLTDEVVSSIRQQAKRLPDGLREKFIQLRFAQAKRKKAYENAGFVLCECGRWMMPGEKKCLFCRLEEKHHQRLQVRVVLQEMPWLSLEKTLAQIGLKLPNQAYEAAYNEVRRNLIYQYIEKIYFETDSESDDLILAMLITRQAPGDIPEKFIKNLVARYRKKETTIGSEAKNER